LMRTAGIGVRGSFDAAFMIVGRFASFSTPFGPRSWLPQAGAFTYGTTASSPVTPGRRHPDSIPPGLPWPARADDFPAPAPSTFAKATAGQQATAGQPKGE